MCKNVRLYCASRRRLCLSFDRSKIWLREESKEGRNRSLQVPVELSLDHLLQQNSLHEEQAEQTEVHLKRSLLALQLASLLHRLYPGPWLQKDWNARDFQLLCIHGDNTTKDVCRVGIPCQLFPNWEATNPVWNEFLNKQDGFGETYPAFFLSFAQLLVDISEGSTSVRSPQKSLQAWCTELIIKAEKLKKNKFLSSYGEAILGCAQYNIDYDIKRIREENPRECARAVIQINIVDKLQENLRFWKAEQESHLPMAKISDFGNELEIGERVHPPPRAAPATKLPQKAAAMSSSSALLRAVARPSYFKLFAEIDTQSTAR